MSGRRPEAPLWTPSPERSARSRLASYTDWLAAKRGLAFDDYAALWQWSVTELEAFWESIWDYYEVRASKPYRQVLGSRAMPGAEWFPGAELNYAEHIFAGRPDEAIAIIHAGETNGPVELSWAELRRATAACAAGLRSLGVGRGDRVAAFLPNRPETVIAFLACASLGATWSSCSPDFGAQSVLDRVGQIEPKVMIAVERYRYGGIEHDRRNVVERLAAEIGSLEHIVIVPGPGESAPSAGAVGWEALLERGSGAALEFEQVPFSHPLWVLYSSGTTGLPKPIVHGHGGILLEYLKYLHLHVDLSPGDRLFWFTTTGWMMWNFLVGGLLTGATIVLYDGNPGFPTLDTLWDLASSSGVTCFGTSAAFIGSCMKEGVEPRAGRDLSSVRSLGSTGSPLSPEAFRWVIDHVSSELWLFSMSGGTDVGTAFLGGVPTLPVYAGELQAPSLGASVESWDEAGRPLIDAVGELVLTAPLPSMPIFFWGDESGSRYRESYFDVYPGVWRHGDWIKITSRGSAVIYGRSDATINRAGVRIGTSEIYRALNTLPAVADALVLDLPRPGTPGWIILFVVLGNGVLLDDELRSAIGLAIREFASPRHVPNEIRQIPEVPRTLSGKLLEIPVKRILMGADPATSASRDSLSNPAALEYFVELARSLG